MAPFDLSGGMWVNPNVPKTSNEAMAFQGTDVLKEFGLDRKAVKHHKKKSDQHQEKNSWAMVI